MKNSIKRFEQLPPELKKKQQESETEFNVGDLFFHHRDGTVIKIREIKKWDKKKDEWEVYYDHNLDYECTKWSSYGSDSFDRFIENIKKENYVKITKPFDEVMKDALDLINGKVPMTTYSKSGYESSLNEERAIMGKSSKEGLMAIEKTLAEKKQTALMIARAVELEMEKRKASLDVIKSKLYDVVEKFQKQIKKIMRVITTIELYLGVDEELHQIQEGEKAPMEEAISFRQMCLYIDEEVGIHEDGGLDFRNIKQFDDWLLTGNHLDIVLPEKKGIVVLKPRRHDKRYGNHWMDVYWNLENKRNTYLLIRNGDNVYRIFTDKLVIMDRLFPRRAEMKKLMEDLEKADFDSQKEKIEDLSYHYRKTAILLQGLIDRTEIFHPLKYEKINLFKLDEQQDAVRFIYDDEMTLPSGRKSYKEWHEKMNKGIKDGSRILITTEKNDRYGKGDSDRFYYYSDKDNYPPAPGTGIYEVDEYKWQSQRSWVDKGKKWEEAQKSPDFIKEIGISRGGQMIYYRKEYFKEEQLTIMYNPKDEVQNVGWSWKPHERKKGVRYRIWRDDSFVLNYDTLELEDVEFYLHSRVDRESYLYMMPVLKEVRKFRLKELKSEDDFRLLIIGRNRHIQDVEKRVNDAIKWWKFKTQTKRPIQKDDEKALRMIEKRIKYKRQ